MKFKVKLMKLIHILRKPIQCLRKPIHTLKIFPTKLTKRIRLFRKSKGVNVVRPLVNKVRLKRILAFFVSGLIVFGSFSYSAYATGQLVETKPTFTPTPSTIPGDLTIEQAYEIIDEGIAAVLEAYGFSEGSVEASFYDMMYQKLKADDCHLSYGPNETSPNEYEGTYCLYSSPGVWNENYLMLFCTTLSSSWIYYSHTTFMEYARARLAAEYSASQFNADDYVQTEPISIKSEILKDYITETDTKYTPKNAIGKMSFRTDDFFHMTILKNDKNSFAYNYWYLYNEGFKAIGGGDEIYLLFFVTYGGETYYSQYQYHFLMNTEDVWFEDRDEIEYIKYQLAYEYWDFMYSDEQSLQSGTMFTDKDCSFFRFYFSGDVPNISGFSDFSKFSTTNSGTVSYYIPGLNKTKPTPFYASDRSTSINFGDYIRQHFKGSVASHDANGDTDCDIGYIASATPIKSNFDIDVTRIPDNYYVTISGDTVYDYSITNPETGQSSSIEQFVTNNYTYVTINNGSESGSGVGGDLSVGGHIDVGGKVDIDININDSVSLPSVSEGDGENFFGADALDVFAGLTKNNPIMATLTALFGVIDPALVATFSVTISLCFLLAIWRLIRRG